MNKLSRKMRDSTSAISSCDDRSLTKAWLIILRAEGRSSALVFRQCDKKFWKTAECFDASFNGLGLPTVMVLNIACTRNNPVSLVR